jgi:serine/threonine protein kinase
MQQKPRARSPRLHYFRCAIARLTSAAAGHYDQSVDIWASGCIFAELLGRQPLFPGGDFKQTLQMHLKVLGSRPAGVFNARL